MIKARERWIQVYDSVLSDTSDNDHIPPPSMIDIARNLKKIKDKDKLVTLIENNTAALRLRNVEINHVENYIFFLIQFTDTKISDPVFDGLKASKIRKEPKLAGEGLAFSSHVLIHQDRIDTDRYLTVVESIPGLSASKLIMLFNFLFRTHLKYRVNPKESNSKLSYCKLGLEGHLGPTIKDKIKTGKLQAIQFITNKKTSKIDEPNIPVQIQHTLEYTFPVKPTGNLVGQAITKIKNKYTRNDYDRIRIIIKNKAGLSRSDNDIDTSEDELLKDALIDKEKVKFTHNLSQCYTEAHTPLLTDMKDILKRALKRLNAEEKVSKNELFE